MQTQLNKPNFRKYLIYALIFTIQFSIISFLFFDVRYILAYLGEEYLPLASNYRINDWIFIILFLLLNFAINVIYFLPTILAERFSHNNKTAIAVLNLLAGWTLIGWIIALVWAFTTSKPQLICPKCKISNTVGSQFCNNCATNLF